MIIFIMITRKFCLWIRSIICFIRQAGRDRTALRNPIGTDWNYSPCPSFRQNFKYQDGHAIKV